jgi:hypothetical protein
MDRIRFVRAGHPPGGVHEQHFQRPCRKCRCTPGIGG